MNQDQINRKEMYEAVNSFLDANSAKWTAIPKVAEFKNAFANVTRQISDAQYAQLETQVFLGKNKTQLKNTVAQKADILNDSIEAFALVSGNMELANKMATSYTHLNRLRNAEFVPAIKAIVTAADDNAETLQGEYGVTAEQIEGLKDDFDDFLAINGEPRAYRIASVQATKDLELLFTDATDILKNKLDKVMSIFKRSDVNFYNGYLAARVIVDN